MATRRTIKQVQVVKFSVIHKSQYLFSIELCSSKNIIAQFQFSNEEYNTMKRGENRHDADSNAFIREQIELNIFLLRRCSMMKISRQFGFYIV